MALLLAIFAAPVLTAGLRLSGRTATVFAGVALMCGGGILLASGIRRLGPALSPLPRPSESGELAADGVYGRMRHPMYAGLVLGAAGWSLFTASLLAAALTVALAVVLDLKSRREEAWLLERFAAYSAYVERTKRFVPRIY